MNKYILLIAVAGCVALGGVFYVTQAHRWQPVKIHETSEIGDTFQKKIDCEKLTASISQKIQQHNDAQKVETRDSNNSGEGAAVYNRYIENSLLKEVFYSPKVNSCLYLESRRTLVKRGVNVKLDEEDWSISYETWYLVDALMDKEVELNDGLPFLQIVNRGEVFSDEKEANTIIDKYK